jgi:hypothetical protein
MERQAAFWSLDRDLHASHYYFEDGIKGMTLSYTPEPDPYEMYPLKPYSSSEEVRFQKIFCRSDLIVVATEAGSNAFLTANKRVIYTNYQFRIAQVLKSSPATDETKPINVIQIGGTVTDDGETLRMEENSAPPFARGQDYLLFLHHPPAAPSSHALFTPSESGLFFPVASGRLLFEAPPSPQGPTRYFVPEETVDDVAKSLDQAVQTVPCSK